MKDEAMLRVERLKKYFPIRGGLAETIFSGQKRYIRAVDDVSFRLGRGEIFGVVGESGCGKSTLSRTILKLIEPTSGQVYFEGTEVACLDRNRFKKFRRRMQMIFQDPFGSLNPRRTVADTLRQTIRTHSLAESKTDESSLIKKALKAVGLEPVDEFWDKYPALLSGGQLQRVSIGRVLILQPSLVIADEAVSMLDVSVRIGILDLLLEMRDRFGMSFIYITHDLVIARYICDRIAIMYLGKIVEIGETEAILTRPAHPYTQALICAVPLPDPTAEVPEVPIKGYMPATPDGASHGCGFYPRCPRGKENCRGRAPQLVRVEDDHYVACLEV
jgi:peptide/nickel transport system ATP-binding protein